MKAIRILLTIVFIVIGATAFTVLFKDRTYSKIASAGWGLLCFIFYKSTDNEK
jgi:hypothetical protein